MKRTITIFLALALLCALPVGAAPAVTVSYDGAALDVPAVLRQGVTYVPLRAFCDAVGRCEVRWDGARRQASVSGAVTLTVTAGAATAQCAAGTVALAGASYLENGTLWTPVRALGAGMDCQVSWLAGSRSAALTSGSVWWLARIIEAEAGGEPRQGKIAVGNVVLNRVASADFPDSVYGVIFDRVNGVQFTPAANGAIWCTPSAASLAAARACLAGESAAGACLYFFNPRTATLQSWIVQNRAFHSRIGNHDFYL